MDDEELLKGLLHEGISKVIRHIFPSRLANDLDMAGAGEIARKALMSLSVEDMAKAPELKHVCILMGVPDTAPLEDIKNAIEEATQAQKVVDGRRVVTNCLGFFALSKVCKSIIKNCATQAEEVAKNSDRSDQGHHQEDQGVHGPGGPPGADDRRAKVNT